VGTGQFEYAVMPNSAVQPRSGHIAIGNVRFIVNQQGANPASNSDSGGDSGGDGAGSGGDAGG
jgi:hypothetical protein